LAIYDSLALSVLLKVGTAHFLDRAVSLSDSCSLRSSRIAFGTTPVWFGVDGYGMMVDRLFNSGWLCADDV